MAPPSRSQVKRCGKLLRSSFASSSDDAPWEQIQHALDVLAEYRSTFSYPLTKVTMGLRAMVKTETRAKPVVAQRLKRMERIMDKLVRLPSMDVTRMEDIGGCRAVLRNPPEVEGVLRRIRHRWEITRFRNYASEPRSSGYRAIHVVVVRDGHLIEVQLRTQGQQEWADQVENFAGRYGLPLKDEQGPDPVLEFFRLAGRGIYSQEYGASLSTGFEGQFGVAATALRRWMAEQGR